MNTENTIFLDTKDLIPIQPSGFVSPSQRVHYWDEMVQNFLFDAFEGMFPKLVLQEDGRAAYHNRTPSTDSFIACESAASLEDIPHSEAMKLLQGWITLRKLVTEATVPEGVRSLLMNLKIPNPRTSPWLYCVKKMSDGQAKLYILFGFEGPALASVPLEEGIAAMLNVPRSQLESLLATSMTPSGNTKRVQLPDTSVNLESANKAAAHSTEKKSLSKNPAILAVAAVILLSMVTLLVGMGLGGNKDKVIAQEAQEVSQPMQPVQKPTVAMDLKPAVAMDLKPIDKPNLEMAVEIEKNTPAISDDLTLEMVAKSGAEATAKDTEEASDVSAMIQQMTK